MKKKKQKEVCNGHVTVARGRGGLGSSQEEEGHGGGGGGGGLAGPPLWARNFGPVRPVTWARQGRPI